MIPMLAHSEAATAEAAVAEIRARLSAVQPRVLVFFAAPSHDGETLARLLREAFPDAAQLGCSTAGELSSHGMRKGSVTVMALPASMVRSAHVELVEGLREGARVLPAVARLEARLGRPLASLGYEDAVGLVLMDGLSGQEERVMEELGEASHLRFVGGSAGDDLRFERTWVAANGRVRSDAAVLAVLQPTGPWSILKTQSFRVLPGTLVATRVDEARRLVLEFNGKPALNAYAEALGCASEEAVQRFMKNPVGLLVDGEPFVRSPMRVEGKGMVFYCQVKQGMELKVLEGTDVVGDTRRALVGHLERHGPARAMINFNCILRTLQLEREGKVGEYGEVFRDVPTVGFSTYGEQYAGHMNQTATVLILH